MSAPEQLNVLLSRARDGLIMIGNAETYSTARKGSDLWTRFFGLLKLDNHIYEGLPVKCERLVWYLHRWAVNTLGRDHG